MIGVITIIEQEAIYEEYEKQIKLIFLPCGYFHTVDNR